MRAWAKRSFKNRIFITILLVALLPLFLCAVLMLQVQIKRSEAELIQQANQELDSLAGVLTETLEGIDAITHELATSTLVRSTLRRGGSDSRVLYQFLFHTTNEYRNAAQFDIYDSSGFCRYTTASDLPDKAMELDWGIIYAARHDEGFVLQENGRKGLIGARAIRTYDGNILGYLVVTLWEEGIESLFRGRYSSVNNVILLDPTWRAAYYSQSAQGLATTGALREQLLNGEPLTGREGEFNFYVREFGDDGFTLILQQPRTFTSAVMRSLYSVSAITGLLCLILCLGCAWVLSRHLSKPVDELDTAMREVEKGNYEIQLETSRTDEFGRLASSFNRMTREYLLNLESSVQRQKELNETQLRMMQAQLNPHFLYNTLDSMKWLGVTHGVPQVATLATNLATILRASISEGEFVTLQQELELIERYIDIQSIRFGDRFTCEIDIDDKFQSCLVPKLVLQPLVENAIIHGVEGRNDGYIKVRAEEQDGALLLTVSDNGRGIPEEILEKLNSPNGMKPSGHLGLYNVDRIIRLHYGDQYGISAESVKGEGSRVQLRLPIQREEKNDAEGTYS